MISNWLCDQMARFLAAASVVLLSALFSWVYSLSVYSGCLEWPCFGNLAAASNLAVFLMYLSRSRHAISSSLGSPWLRIAVVSFLVPGAHAMNDATGGVAASTVGTALAAGVAVASCMAASGEALEDLELRGVSVHHLQHVLLEEVRQLEITEQITDAKVYEIEESVIRGRGANQVCPRDGLRGTAYVDAIGEQAVGRATFMLS